MRKVALVLHSVSRVLAVCACIAGLGGGFLLVLLAGFVCFDSCPSPEGLPSGLALLSVWLMIPCVALEVLALAAFVPYGVTTGQARRAVRQAGILLGGGLVGVAALGALILLGQATSWGNFGNGALESWARFWGVVLMVVAGAWAGVLAYLEWGR
ncbi:MAG TPA: hypothetical protein VF807_02785 [Ktedonobacterales bacterium]